MIEERSCETCKYEHTHSDSTYGYPSSIVWHIRECRHPDKDKQHECEILIQDIYDSEYTDDSEPIDPVEDCPHWVDYRPLSEIRKEKLEEFIKNQHL